MKQTTSLTLRGVVDGIRCFAPLAPGVFAYGLVYGMLAQQAGLSLAESMLMSVLVAAGSAQFVVVGMWQPQLPVLSVWLTTFVVNLRYVIMGIAIHRYLNSLPAVKVYPMLHVMGDENWAMTMREFEQGKSDAGFFLGSGAFSQAMWIAATPVGYLASGAIPDPSRFGLDFAFTAVFLTLLTTMWKGKSSFLPLVTSAFVAVAAAQLIGGKWYIVTGGLAGSLIGAWQNDD